jgi:hypothetical protein
MWAIKAVIRSFLYRHIRKIVHVITFGFLTILFLLPSNKVFATTYTSQIPSLDGTHVRDNSHYDGSYVGLNAADPSKSLTGSYTNTSWVSAYPTPEKIMIQYDLGSILQISRLYYENLHDSGYPKSILNFELWATNDVTKWNNGTTYAYVSANWTQISTTTTALEPHVASDITDPKYVYTTGTPSYEYWTLVGTSFDTLGLVVSGLRRLEFQTADAEPTPTITPTPSASPTPTITPTPTPNPGYYIPPSEESSSCSVSLFDSVGGNQYYEIRNFSAQNIKQIDFYGSFCWPGTVSCGFGYTQGSSGINLSDDWYIDWYITPNHATWKWFTGFTKDSYAIFNTRLVDSATCTYDDNSIVNAIVPYGSFLNPAEATASGSITGIPTTCSDLEFTVPVINWYFHFPNWLCELKKFIGSLFSIDWNYSNTKYNELKSNFSNTAIVGIMLQLPSLDFSHWNVASDSAVTEFPEIHIPIQTKYCTSGICDDSTLINIDIATSSTNTAIPFVNTVKTVIKYGLWFIFLEDFIWWMAYVFQHG